MHNLAQTLIYSTSKRIACSIANKKSRNSYLIAVDRCLRCLYDYKSAGLHRVKRELELLIISTPKTFSIRFEVFSDTKGSYMLGIRHSLDVVNSIIIRFDTGYTSADEVFVKS